MSANDPKRTFDKCNYWLGKTPVWPGLSIFRNSAQRSQIIEHKALAQKG